MFNRKLRLSRISVHCFVCAGGRSFYFFRFILLCPRLFNFASKFCYIVEVKVKIEQETAGEIPLWQFKSPARRMSFEFILFFVHCLKSSTIHTNAISTSLFS